MKLAQAMHLWFNQSGKELHCYQCKVNLSYNKQKHAVPPLIISRKGHPYCMICSWKFGFTNKIGVVKHA